jgi:uncharacterized membrane protein YkvA (DUF1232 family)
MNWEGFKARAKDIKKNVVVLSKAAIHPRTPWYAKLFTFLVVAYALSPIDLIPDFIPVLGYLDDLILLPVGIWLAIKLIPEEVLAECRENTMSRGIFGKYGFWGAVLIIVFWLAIVYLVINSLNVKDFKF